VERDFKSVDAAKWTVLEENNEIPSKYRKWLTKKAWFNCFRVAVALFFLAWLFEYAHAIVFAEINPIWLKSLFLIVMGFFFSFILWFLALLSPELMETLFSMLGFKDEEDKKNEDMSQNEV